ncbi:MAG: polysaccharide deacetylase [Acidobacteria bacterium]|nr:polysaccharide deacetylase [Acidobacteriota bacterium]
MTTPKDVRVALTFDYDAMSNWINTSGGKSPGMISRGEFGPIALRRVLALLESRGITTTFFVPGHTALAFPDTVKAIQAMGHEIGHHGWVHENPATLSPDEERRVLERGLDALQRVAGIRPVGYRSPGWDNSVATVPLLLEYGFEYESSLMGSDFEPYWCRVGDEISTSEEFRWGTPVDLVEVPVAWHLDDFIQFEFVATPSGILNAARSPTMCWEIWTAEFDYLYERVGRGILNITMHPQVIGRGHRLLFLERFIEYVGSRPGVSFTTLAGYVRQWRAGRAPQLPKDAGPARASPR